MMHSPYADGPADARSQHPTAGATPTTDIACPPCRTPVTLDAQALRDLEAGGTDPTPPTPTDAHRLLSLALELSALLPGHRSLELRVDNMAPACATIRVDREDWPRAVRALESWLDLCLDEDDGDRVTRGAGFVNVFIRRRGLVRVRSAAVVLAIGGDS